MLLNKTKMEFYLSGRLNMSVNEVVAALITVAILLVADHYITKFRKNRKKNRQS